MTELLDLIAERGYPLSALYPATMPIYRSLGWELAGAKHQFTVPARSLRRLREPDEAARGGGAGHRDVPIRRAGPADAATVIKVIGGKPPGRPRRGPADLGRRTGRAVAWPPGPVLLPGGRRRLRRLPVGRGDDLWVERVHARTPETLRALWSVIASHSSTTDNVSG